MSGEGEAITMARLAAILDAYGAEPRLWPAAERAAAERLLGSSAAARALAERARRVDHVLAESVAPGPSSALRSAILAAAPGFDRAPSPPWRALIAALAGALGGPRPAGAVLVLALLLGIVAGGSVGIGSETAEPDTDLLQLALFDDQLAAEY